jgi:hypothetical protein
MKYLNFKLCYSLLCILMLPLISCQEEDAMLESRQLRQETDLISDNSRLLSDQDKLKNPGGENDFPNPTIHEWTFIPEIEEFAHTKCKVWQINWPAYHAGTDQDQIPSYFSVEKGSLHSLDFLLSIDAANKATQLFSLYRNEQILGAFNDTELYNLVEPNHSKAIYFGSYAITLESLSNWVTGRPTHFENRWVYVEDVSNQADYVEGDFFIFQIPDANIYESLYGGIRIVSMSPRIIEVYLAVPNEEHEATLVGLNKLK